MREYVARVSHRAQQSFHKILFTVSSSAESGRESERNSLHLLLLHGFPLQVFAKNVSITKGFSQVW